MQSTAVDGNAEMVKLLFSAKADPNTQGEYSGSALQSAVTGNTTLAAEILFKAGADTNSQGGGFYGSPLKADSGYSRNILLSWGALGGDSDLE